MVCRELFRESDAIEKSHLHRANYYCPSCKMALLRAFWPRFLQYLLRSVDPRELLGIQRIADPRRIDSSVRSAPKYIISNPSRTAIDSRSVTLADVDDKNVLGYFCAHAKRSPHYARILTAWNICETSNITRKEHTRLTVGPLLNTLLIPGYTHLWNAPLENTQLVVWISGGSVSFFLCTSSM